MANVRTSNRSGVFRRGGAVVRRQSLWLFLTPTRTTLSAANSAVLSNSLSAAALALRPFTVVRSRGTMHLESDQSAASEFYQCSSGLCVVSSQAVAIGVTAVPTPETDRGSDLFLMYETLESGFELGDATGFQNTTGVRKDWDSRAMRKVVDDQDLILVSETSVASTGAVVTTSGRILIKLH